MKNILSPTSIIRYVFDLMDELIVWVDQTLRIQYMNSTAEHYFNINGMDYDGKHFSNDIDFVKQSSQNKRKILEDVMRTRKSIKGYINRNINNRVLSINAIPVINDGMVKGALFTGRDVTEMIDAQEELDSAFSLVLPNSKVKYKLMNTIEYQDKYNPETKMITITGVIADGGYRHVINCLRLFANLYEKGITKIIGINKDLLVQAFISR